MNKSPKHKMRPPTSTSYTMIPLRSPFPGAPPRYVAVAVPPGNKSSDRPHKNSGAKAAVDEPSSQSPKKAAPAPVPATPTATKPNEPILSMMQLPRARSVPLQEMREATIAVRDNARLGGRDRDATTTDRRDGWSSKEGDGMPADDLHPLKYWARQHGSTGSTEFPSSTTPLNFTRSSTGSCEV